MARGVSFIVSPVAGSLASAYAKATTYFNRLALTVSGYGASLVGVADSASYLTSTGLEAALAELGILRPVVITDPGNGGAIPVTRSGTCAITTTAAQTRTLAVPTFVNQRIILYFKTDGGDCVVTVAAAINVTGNTVITLNDANDSIQLVGVSNGTSLVWRVAENDGTSLS